MGAEGLKHFCGVEKAYKEGALLLKVAVSGRLVWAEQGGEFGRVHGQGARPGVVGED